MTKERQPVVIVGAGPYGLAVAAHLRAAHVDVQVFGDVMEFWKQSTPIGMQLRSSWSASHISSPYNALSLDQYETQLGTRVRNPIPRADFLAYAEWFQQQAVPDLDRRKVTCIDQDSDTLRLTLADGDVIQTRRVILATGLAGFSYRPPQFSDLPPELASHSTDYGDLSQFADRSVAVVGGGQSALESAVLLAESGARVEVLMRAPQVRWVGRNREQRHSTYRRLAYHRTDVGPAGLSWVVAFPELVRHLPSNLRRRLDAQSIRPAGSAWLRPRMENVRLTTGRAVTSAAPSDSHVILTLDNGTTRIVDHVLLATGYRINVSRHRLLAANLVAAIRQSNGYPVLKTGFESSVPGLHFVGAPAAWTFGPIMRFVAGTEYTARELTRALVGGVGMSAAWPEVAHG